jgi:hypothetical protein
MCDYITFPLGQCNIFLIVNAPSVVTSNYNKLVQMKPVQELFLATLLKIAVVWIEARPNQWIATTKNCLG